MVSALLFSRLPIFFFSLKVVEEGGKRSDFAASGPEASQGAESSRSVKIDPRDEQLHASWTLRRGNHGLPFT